MLKKLENNNIGATSYIEKTMMYLVVFFVSTFILDLVILAATMIITNHQLNYVASKLQFQSGFVGERADDDFSSLHWFNDDVFNYLNAGMKSVGIDGTEYLWELSYVPDIYSKNAELSKENVIYQSNGNKKYWYTTPGRVNISNLGDAQSGDSNIYTYSKLIITYDHYYRFSGRVFYMLHADTKISLKTVFQNRYVG